MTSHNPKNQNTINLYLNNYFDALVAVVVVIFLAAAYFLVIGPKVTTTQQDIQSKLDGEQSLYAISQKKLASLTAIGQIYSKISPTDLQKFNSVLPAAYVPERLYGELEEIIGSGGWRLNSLALTYPGADATAGATVNASSTLAAIGDPNLHGVNVELTVSALDYTGLQSLLHLLENNLRLLDITQVTFSPSGGSADLTFTTYYYQVPK